MNRFGILPKDVNRCLAIINEMNLKLTGIYSHNAGSNKELINSQLESFYYAVKDLKDVDIHYAASSLIDNDIKYQTCKRIGDFIYQNAFTVTGKILKVNYVEKHEYIGYDYAYQMKKNAYIGVIDLGYADGLDRNCNGFLVYVRNKYYHLIGKACMNHSFVLLNDDKLDIGDIVHIISSYNNISNYERFFGKTRHEIYLSFLKK